MLWRPGVGWSVALGFAYSLANAAGRPALMATLSEVPAEVRGAILGLNVSMSSIGWLAATAVGGWLVARHGFGSLGILTAVVSSAGALLGVLAWYARNGSKPGREARESWVLHASPDWSFVELDQSPEYVKRALLERFARIIGLELPRALVTDAHRWRHARVQSPAGEAFLLDREAGIGFCGDWCLEARAEAAWRSGTALGEELARTRAMPASGKIRESR